MRIRCVALSAGAAAAVQARRMAAHRQAHSPGRRGRLRVLGRHACARARARGRRVRACAPKRRRRGSRCLNRPSRKLAVDASATPPTSTPLPSASTRIACVLGVMSGRSRPPERWKLERSRSIQPSAVSRSTTASAGAGASFGASRAPHPRPRRRAGCRRHPSLERLRQRGRLRCRGHDRPHGAVRAAVGGDGVGVQIQRRSGRAPLRRLTVTREAAVDRGRRHRGRWRPRARRRADPAAAMRARRTSSRV